jgi:hypothetical protein
MKKLLLSLGLLVGIAGAARAQEARFGLKAGLGLSSVRGTDVGDGYKYLFGVNGGLMADFGFSDRLSFHPELLYSQKGTKLDYTTSYANAAGTLTVTQIGKGRLHYLDLPLLLRLKASGFFLEAGPQLGYLLAQRSELTATGTTTYTGSTTTSTITKTETDDSTDGIRRFDVGYIIGIGYQLPQGLEVGLRFNNGFSNSTFDRSSSNKVHNSVFQFQVGYLFGGK